MKKEKICSICNITNKEKDIILHNNIYYCRRCYGKVIREERKNDRYSNFEILKMEEKIQNHRRKENNSTIYEFDDENVLAIRTKNDDIFITDLDKKDFIDKFSWRNMGSYPSTSISVSGSKYDIRMNRLIKRKELNDEKIIVDHINGNTKDNRESNLRVCTSSENNMNRISRGITNNTNKTGRIGISIIENPKYPNCKYFIAQICIKGETEYKYFKDFNEALKWREEKELEYFGEFSYYNSRIDDSVYDNISNMILSSRKPLYFDE